MADSKGVYCPHCHYTNRHSSLFCGNCGQRLSVFQKEPQRETDESIANSYGETRYLGGGYKQSDERFPPGYFELDNLLKGTGNFLRNNYKDLIIIYSIFLLVSLAGFYILTIQVLDLLNFYLVEFFGSLIAITDIISIYLTLLMMNLIVLLLRWVPDSIYLRRLDNSENNRKEPWTETISYVSGKWLSYLVSAILVKLISVTVVILSALVVVLVYFETRSLSLTILVLFISVSVTIFALIYLNLRFYISPALVITDDITAVHSLKEGFGITKGILIDIFIVDIGTGFAVWLLQSFISRITTPVIVYVNEVLGILLIGVFSLLITLPLGVLVKSSVLYFAKLYHGHKTNSVHFKRHF